MRKKIEKKVFDFERNASIFVSYVFFIRNGILIIGRECVKNQSQDLACQKERLSVTQLPWQWSIKMIKVFWFRFRQCLVQFTIPLVEGASKTELFKHLSNHVLRVRNFGSTKSMRAIFVSKCSRFNLYFKNAAKNSEKVFCFWNNCIWTGIVKFSLLRKGYLSSPVKVLTSSPKIWHVNKRDFLWLSCLGSDQ